MKYRSVDHELERPLVPPSEGRSLGLHVSDIYNDLYQQIDPKRFNPDRPPNPYKLALGLAWEQYLEQALVRAGVNAERPGEFLYKGLSFSPDLFVVNGHDRIGEIKLTWMVEVDDLEDPKFDKWLTQIKAYCYATGIPRAVLYVYFVNGRGRFGEPSLRAFELEFTARELEENWRTLTNHARRRNML